MPYDGSGIWNLLPSYHVNTGDTLTTASQNPIWEDASVNGFSAVLVRDGRAPMTGNLNMGTTNKITNLANGTAAADGINKSQLDLVGGTYAVKSGNYTALASDNNAVHRYTATATASLTAAATLGANWRYTIIADGGNVTIDPNGAETINGLVTISVPNGTSVKIICDGTGFFTVIKASLWEAIGTFPLSAAANLSITNLAGYSALRATYYSVNSTNASVGFRISIDNGSSYISTSTYQAQTFQGSGASAGAGAATLTFAPASNTIVTSYGLTTIIQNWNATTPPTFHTTGLASDGVASYAIAGGSFAASTGSARNALQFLVSTGTTTGRLSLEGIK